MAYDYNNPWLSTAVGNTQNPNQGYQEYLESIGYYVDPDKVGKFFGGIDEDYQEDIGMARAGFAQGMQTLQTQGQQSAMQLGGGQGLSSAYNSGFGRTKYGMQQGLRGIDQQYGEALQGGLLGYTQDRMDAQRSKESQYRDIAAGLFGRDAEGISTGQHAFLDPSDWGGAEEGGGTTSYGGDTWNPPGWTGGNPNEGATHVDGNGQNWIFRGGRWREA